MNGKLYEVVVSNTYYNAYFRTGKLKKCVVDFKEFDPKHKLMILEMTPSDIADFINSGFDAELLIPYELGKKDISDSMEKIKEEIYRMNKTTKRYRELSYKLEVLRYEYNRR